MVFAILLTTTKNICRKSNYVYYSQFHHHHHLSRSCHCWQMASTTCAMHFDPGPFSSIDCPTASSMSSLHLLLGLPLSRFPSLGVHSDVIFRPPGVLHSGYMSCPLSFHALHFFLLYLSPLFSILLSRS